MFKNKGFSMIEVLLVVAITAIVFAVATPYSLNFYKTQLVDETQKNIIAALQKARHNAVLQKNDSTFGVKISTSTNEYVLFQGESYETRNDVYDEVYDLLPDISYSGPTEIIFSKLTGVANNFGTSTLNLGNISRGIFVTEQGITSSIETTVVVAGSGCTATGGTITTDGDYTIHTFTSDGTFTVTSGSCDAEVLVVAGGGGGGGNHGGGGAGGGLCYQNARSVTTGEYSVTVGNGGVGNDHYSGGGTNGGDSIFDDIIALGGGHGGGYVSYVGPSEGGSGAGGTALDGYTNGALSTQIDSGGATCFGNSGGSSAGRTEWQGGGGGGAGAEGGDSGTNGGNGGDGLSYTISGSAIYYAAGGGGGGEHQVLSSIGLGGNGGGGDGGANESDATAGEDYKGGGGGGQRNGSGKNGGSGVVIVRHLGTGSEGDIGGGGGENPGALINQDLYGYWRFDGNTSDSSGNGNTAGFIGTESYTTGMLSSQAVDLNGVSSVYNPVKTFSSANSYTVGFWFKLANDTPNTTSFFNAYRTDWWSGTIQFGVNYDNGYLTSGICQSGSYCNGSSVNPALSKNVWHYLTMVLVNNYYIKIYLDGDYVETVSLNSAVGDSNMNIPIGGYCVNSQDGVNFKGQVDEFAIWDRALTDSEIHDILYNNGVGTSLNP